MITALLAFHDVLLYIIGSIMPKSNFRSVIDNLENKYYPFGILGFRRPSAAKTLAGSSNGDQSGRINSSHSIIEELARSDWMELSGGDQSG